MRDDRRQAKTEEQVAVLMQRGREAALAGQRARARRYFAAVLEIQPRHKEAWLARAAVVDDPQEAMAHLVQVLAIDPAEARAHAGIRNLRRAAGNRPAYRHEALVPAVSISHAPVPRPLVAAGEPPERPARPWPWGWAVLALVSLAFVVLALAGDTPRSVLAALLPTPTPTPTYTPTPTNTPTPTYTPTPTHTPTPTYTPTPTPTYTPTPMPTATPTPTRVPADQSEAEKWIEVDLSEQRLYAHEGQATVLNAVVSTGTWQYPTVTGRFRVYAKYRATRMTGPGYDLPNVPWTMFFYAGYAIHGTYWHNNFGHPMSHGCVNMTTTEAKWLYEWAPQGTLVVVHQ